MASEGAVDDAQEARLKLLLARQAALLEQQRKEQQQQQLLASIRTRWLTEAFSAWRKRSRLRRFGELFVRWRQRRSVFSPQLIFAGRCAGVGRTCQLSDIPFLKRVLLEICEKY